MFLHEEDIHMYHRRYLTIVSLQMREEIELCGIKIYQFPDCDSDEDEEFKQQDLALKVRVYLCRLIPPSKI